jgi:putative ABC transport system permease protein
VQREDVTVVFTRPMNDRAVLEIGHVPGVRLAEGVRAVPVRMGVGAREKRVELLGLQEHSTLHRLVGSDGASVALPPDGVVLSRHLARRLAVGVGERVSIAVLEGTRARRELTVAAVVDEMLGIGAYVHIDALARLLGEAPTASAVLVAVMPGQTGAVHEALRALPGVATVTVKAAIVRRFDETMAQIMVVFSLVLSAFGALVVVGVVYNGARILVAERSREVATLRVLGFSEGDVSAFVLLELAVQVVAGLPVGAALGYGLAAIAVRLFGPEDMSIPLVVGAGTWAIAVAVVLGSATASALAVRRRLDRLDLVGVLKVRE